MSTERNDAALPDEIEKAIERFDAACQSWGWQADQGSDGEAIGASSAEYTASGAALRSAISTALKEQRHRATNAEYMAQAYRNMLGENGLAVAKRWDESGVTRVHFDWGPEAGFITGEERAAEILKVEATALASKGEG